MSAPKFQRGQFWETRSNKKAEIIDVKAGSDSYNAVVFRVDDVVFVCYPNGQVNGPLFENTPNDLIRRWVQPEHIVFMLYVLENGSIIALKDGVPPLHMRIKAALPMEVTYVPGQGLSDLALHNIASREDFNAN